MKKDPQFRSKRSVPVVLLIAAAAVGFYLSLPISGLGGKEDLSEASPPSEGNVQVFSSDKEIQLLENELDSARQEVMKLEKELLDEKVASQDRLRMVKGNRELAGLTDVIGEGVIITLSEKKGNGGFVQKPGKSIIHQEDLLNIINELWYHGAEAIAVGSPDGGEMERITTFSPAHCDSGIIWVNKTEMYPPFEIRATGKAGLLKSVLERRTGYLEILSTANIESKVETSEAVYIPRYSGLTKWRYTHSLLAGIEDVVEQETGSDAEAEG
jgi:uncharacterized protein YlxW (UPF0749 family)